MTPVTILKPCVIGFISTVSVIWARSPQMRKQKMLNAPKNRGVDLLQTLAAILRQPWQRMLWCGAAGGEQMSPSPLGLYLRWNNQKGAENICKQIGYTEGTRYTAGGGTGPINAGNRLCNGGEKTIFDCELQKERTDTTGCSHSHDQGVKCTGGD